MHSHGWAPVSFSSGSNHVEMTKLLLEHGADVNTKDKQKE